MVDDFTQKTPILDYAPFDPNPLQPVQLLLASNGLEGKPFHAIEDYSHHRL